MPEGQGCPPLQSGRADGLAALCDAWLAVDLEIERLSRRWSDLEAEAAHRYGWFGLCPAERMALPAAAEMAGIDARLETLFETQARTLAALAALKPHDPDDAAAKLAVAARLSRHEGGEVHRFIVEALDVLTASEGPACGAPRVPAGQNR